MRTTQSYYLKFIQPIDLINLSGPKHSWVDSIPMCQIAQVQKLNDLQSGEKSGALTPFPGSGLSSCYFLTSFDVILSGGFG